MSVGSVFLMSGCDRLLVAKCLSLLKTVSAVRLDRPGFVIVLCCMAGIFTFFLPCFVICHGPVKSSFIILDFREPFSQRE